MQPCASLLLQNATHSKRSLLVLFSYRAVKLPTLSDFISPGLFMLVSLKASNLQTLKGNGKVLKSAFFAILRLSFAGQMENVRHSMVHITHHDKKSQLLVICLIVFVVILFCGLGGNKVTIFFTHLARKQYCYTLLLWDIIQTLNLKYRILLGIQGDQDHFFPKEMLISPSILKLHKNPWIWEGLTTIHFI